MNLGEARDASISDSKKTITKLHVNWGHAPAPQPKRVLVDSEGGHSHFVNFADEVLEHCDVCRAFDMAPHGPTAGTSTVWMFNEMAQAGLLFLGDLVALRAMDMFSKNSLILPARSKNPPDVWDSSRGGWLGTFGPPKCLQMDERGDWKNEIWTDLRAELRIKLQFQGVGAHPWLLGRRNGLARGIFFTVLLKMMGSRTGRFSRRRNGVRALCYRPVVFLRIRWASDPIGRICLVGRTRMRP